MLLGLTPVTVTPVTDEDRLKTGTVDLSGLVPSGRSSRKHVYVVVLAGIKAGAVYQLGDGETVIGRSPLVDITLPDDGVSRSHVKLIRSSPSKVLLEDLGSTNGTFAQGERVDRAHLVDGDRFEVAGTLLKVYFGDELEANLQRNLYESAIRDPLTGLYNRRHLEERLNSEYSFAARHGSPLGLIIIDIDHFKQVNDTYGHQVGDDVLKDVSDALHHLTREEDIVGRYGGEEFAIVARQTTLLQAARLAERTRIVIDGLTVRCGEDEIHVTVSVGVACHGSTSYDSSDELFKAADQALYRAKDQGRNRVNLADDRKGGDLKATQV